jgi:hypothetical protein
MCKRTEDAVQAADAFGYPVLIKPVRTVIEVDGAIVRRDSRLVRDERELRAAQTRVGRCLVQRWTAGGLLSFAGVVGDGAMLGAGVSRYRRMWPPQAGNVSFSETIDAPGGLCERVRSLVTPIAGRGCSNSS